MIVHFFNDELERFIQDLEKPTIAKVLRTVDLLERFSHDLGMPHSKKIAPRLYELRIRGQQEIRIFYTFHQNAIILLHGFVKKSQQLPRRELGLAYRRLRTLDTL